MTIASAGPERAQESRGQRANIACAHKRMRDHRAMRTRHPNPPPEDVIAGSLDAAQDLEIDRAHDLGGKKAPAVRRREGRRGFRVVEARALALEPHQAADRRRQPAHANVVFGDPKSREIFRRKVEAAIA